MSLKNVNLQVRTFWCNKTTGDGNGDVYFIVGGKKSDGSTIINRVPDTGTFNLSDSGGNNDQRIEVKYGTIPILWSGNLEDGESVTLTVAIMAGDKGDTGTALEVAGEMANQTDADGETAVGTNIDILQAVGSFLKSKTADFSGAFAVKVANKNDKISDDWQSRDRCIDRGGDVNGRTFHFAGDNTIYFATFGIG